MTAIERRSGVAAPATYNEDRTKHPYIRPLDAATLVIVDSGHATPKVLVGRRHDKLTFMPGALVFPGGRVEPKDSAVSPAIDIPPMLEARLMEGSPRTSRSRARALAFSAIREACEETGLCIGRKAESQMPRLPPAFQPFADHGLVPTPSSLFLVARAITPPGRIKRYDTRFFAADASAIAHRIPNAVDANSELVELIWVDIDAEPLSQMHAMTVRVLAHLQSLLAEGPLRHHTPVPFYRWRDGRMQAVHLTGKA